MDDKYWIRKAIDIAIHSMETSDEVPVAAIVVKDGQCLATAVNSRISTNKVSAHAEIVAMDKAAQLTGDWRLNGCSLYVTLEPCPMCLGAIVESRVSRVVFSAFDYKNGALGGKFNMLDFLDKRASKIEVVTGICLETYQNLLNSFFSKLRDSY